MKILLVCHGYPPERSGGTESYTAFLAESLAERHDVAVFFRTTAHAPPVARGIRPGARAPQLHGYRFVFPRIRPYPLSYRNPGAEGDFREFVREFRPDVVHFTYLLSGLSVGLVEIARAADAPVVVTLTDYGLLCPRGQLLDETLSLCDGRVPPQRCVSCFHGPAPFDNAKPLRAAQRRLATLLSPLGAWSPLLSARKIEHRRVAIARSLRSVDAFLAPSRVLGDLYVAHGLPRERVLDLCFGIDEAPFESFRRIPHPRLRFGFIGQHLPHKGLHLLIEAAESIADGEFEVHIHGGRERGAKGTAYWRHVLSLVRSDRVRILDKFPPQGVAAVYANLDVVVLPSLWTENAPLVLLQALATRTPVIVSDLGGLSELVVDGKTGFVFPAGDRAALRNRMERFLRDPGLAARFSGAIRPVDGMEVHVRAIEALYGRLLSAKGRVPAEAGGSGLVGHPPLDTPSPRA